MSRLYFFRDIEGYSHKERLNRLHVSDFKDPDLEPVENLIGQTPLTIAELQAATKNEMYNKIQQNLTRGWQDFVESVFDIRGEKGDKFNVKLYFGDRIEYDTLYQEASGNIRDEEDHENLYDSKIRNSLVNIKEREDGILDLRFVVPGSDEYPSDEDDDSITLKHRYAEVRVYTSQDAVAISRRAMNDDDIFRLRDLIETWSGGDIDTQPQLTPNEMLALENAMGGRNIGIDYGQFKGGRSIEKARYRGASNLSPLNSEIVRPASLNGRVVKLKFEHEHTVSNHSWDVKISLQYECELYATKETKPKFIDRLVSELVDIRNYKNLLQTMTDRLEEYRWDIIGQNPAGGIQTYFERRNLALRTAVDSHIQNTQIESVEVQMFRDLTFSIGVELLRTEQIKDDPDGEVPDPPQEKAELKKLFDDYARVHLDDPNYNFDRLWCQLHELLTSEFTSPVDLIESAKSEFEV